MKKILFLSLIMIVMTSFNNPQRVPNKEFPAGNGPQQEVVQPNTLTQAEIDAGWKLLFDGKSADQWRGYNKQDFPGGWEVIDGTIHCKGSGRGEAGQGGDIITKEQFKNFEFAMEWMVGKGGNSGIFYLAREVEGEPIWKNSPEMQILDNVNHPDAQLGIQGNRQAG